MSKQIPIFIIFFFLSLLKSESQNYHKIDSFRNLALTTKKDSILNKIFFELGKEYLYTNTDSSEYFLLKSLELSKKLDDKRYFAEIFNKLGAIEYFRGNYSEAIKFFKKSVSAFLILGDNRNVAKVYGNMGIIYEVTGKYKEALDIYGRALKIYEKLKDKNGVATILGNIGIVYLDKGEYEKSLPYFKKGIKIYEKLGDKRSLAINYGNLGNVYNGLSDYNKALKFYMKALTLSEEIKYPEGIMSNMANVGLIFFNENMYKKALEYLMKAYKLSDSLGYQRNVAQQLGNIAIVYDDMNKYYKAIEYYEKSSKIYHQIGDVSGEALNLGNLGVSYFHIKKYDKALKYLFKSLKLKEKLGNQYGIAVVYGNITDVYNQIGRYNDALRYAEKELELSRKISSLDLIKEAYKGLSMAYQGLGDFKKAIMFKDSLIVIVDSLYSQDKAKAMAEMSAKYESEKKEQQIKLQQAELSRTKAQIARERAEKEKQEAQRNLFVVAFALTFVLVLFVYRSYREKKKINKILERQKNEIAEKNEELNQQNEEIRAQRDEIENQKNILEVLYRDLNHSIIYATKLQKAILPSFETLEKSIKDYFVLFNPKDKVSGDFYWWTYLEDKEKLIVTVADCTGHGVPGAFMSMLGVSLLREIVEKDGVSDTGEILNRLREEVIKALKQRGIEGEQKDGMDMSIVAIDNKTKMLQYSGANNPLYVITKNELNINNEFDNKKVKVLKNGNAKLYELKPDKMPIAIYEKMESFTRWELQLKGGEMLYMFSDGFADQFGGENGKKYKYKPFKNSLLNISNLPMREQGKKLEEELNKWMYGYGVDYEQVDDITVVGIKL